jgi:hypothetical protein
MGYIGREELHRQAKRINNQYGAYLLEMLESDKPFPPADFQG